MNYLLGCRRHGLVEDWDAEPVEVFPGGHGSQLGLGEVGRRRIAAHGRASGLRFYEDKTSI